uniref:Guanine nucleotide-binding protein subunit beta-like protein n=1 Tax=Neobodo designis TaxID=312471 RepID=A0A7S1PKP9_NEODS|mmetsp:Transcript_10457/g.32435  ORF Transcript_10457/g.32435 Transcript_10457/m.32435 type:complete len:625 (+) Transcript_10457:47-1921(+)
MGCGQTKHAAGDQYRSDAGETTTEEGRLDASTERSLARTSSARSMTTVTSTRGRMASSSHATPYLHDPIPKAAPTSEVPSSPLPSVGIGSLRSSSPSASFGSPGLPVASASSAELAGSIKRTFSMGDLVMDPDDVVRQRRERFHRRVSTVSSTSSGSFQASTLTAPPGLGTSSSRRSRGNTSGFRMHDLIMEDDLENPFGLGDAVKHNDHWVRGAESRALHGLPRRVKGLCVVPGGDLFLCSVAESEVVVVRGRKNDNEVRRHPDWRAALKKTGAMDRVAAVAADPAGERFVAISGDGTLVVRDVDSDSSGEGAPKVLFPDDDSVGGFASCIAFAGAGRVVVGDTHGRVRVWDVEKGTSVAAQLHGVNGPRSKSAVHVVCSTRSGDVCLTAGQDGNAHIIDPTADSVEALATYEGHDGQSIKFGGLIPHHRAVTVSDAAAHIWSVADAVPCFVYDMSGLSQSLRPGGDSLNKTPSPKPSPKHLTSLTIPTTGASPKTPSGCGLGKEAEPGRNAGPCSVWAARVALFGPTGKPRGRIVTCGCILDVNDERVVVAIADTFGDVAITPLPLTANACRCEECSGTLLHFRAPVAVVAATGDGSMIAGDGFGNLYDIRAHVSVGTVATP